jgi:polar amino acid transport system substrate-binding protein
VVASGELQAIFRKWKLWNEEQAAIASRPNAAELAGLGFNAEGQAIDSQAGGDDSEASDIAGESAKAWTFDRYAPLLLQAAGMTVYLSTASMAVAMSLGLFVCVLRLYGFAPLRYLALGYVEFFRGIPLLLLLTFLYFGLPELGVDIGAIAAAILGFGLNYAAYEAEIYRSAIQSVPRGQWEAGRALGMSEPLTFRRVIFPQAFRTALGPMTNDFVAMFKDTSLVSVIAVRELTKEYQILARSSFKYVELGLLTAALYLAMSIPLSYLSRYLEKRWGAGR